MFRAKLSTLLIALLAPAILVGCASNAADPTAQMKPEEILEQAQDYAKNLEYAKAVGLLEKLEGRAAGTPLAQQAQLEKAYAQYKAEEPAQAVATLDRFMRLHPASPAYDYALYLKGLVNFNENLGFFGKFLSQDLTERDQQASKEAHAAFKELATRFPDSRYTPDARSRMTYIVNSLAMSEVHVARYYYKRGAYLAAINRVQQAIADYREAPALEEALYILAESYNALQLTQLRDDARRVLATNYPNSQYATGKGYLTSNEWWRLW